MRRQSVILIFLHLFLGCLPYVKGSGDFAPLKTDSSLARSFYEGIQRSFESDCQEAAKDKELLEAYSLRFEFLDQLYKDSYFIFDPELQEYLNRILERILTTNPDISRDEIRLVATRNLEANASSFGEGTIAVNMGMLIRVKSEAQLAFIICHELGHYALDHTNEGMRKRIAYLGSDEVQAKLKALKKQEYNVRKQGLELLRRMSFDISRHRRETEMETDKLGLQLLRNSGYDARSGITALELLDSLDTPKRDFPLDLKACLDHPEYPFRSRWLQKESSPFIYSEDIPDTDWHVDSLKTHPEIPLRVEQAKALLTDYRPPADGGSGRDLALWADWSRRFDLEWAWSAYVTGDFGRCFWGTLNLQRDYPDSPFLTALLGRCLYACGNARQNHTFGKYVPIAEPNDDSAFNQCLVLLNNLRAENYYALSYWYLSRHRTLAEQDELYLNTMVRVCKALMKQAEAREWGQRYHAAYPQSRYPED